MLDQLIAWIAQCLIVVIQALPLKMVALIGRAGGEIAWWVDARHRKVMLANLAAAFPKMSRREVLGIARENMRRLGENYVSAVKTASMTFEQVDQICEVRGVEKLPLISSSEGPKNCIVAIGHFGNFELNAILSRKAPHFKPAATYRGLKQPALNKIMQMIRERSGCKFYERRTEGRALKNALNEGGLLLGLLSDQHSGNGGVWGPFLGRDCSTTAAPAILALRYDATLLTAICYRTSLARWVIEVGDLIPTVEAGQARSVQALTHDINRALEAGVLRDPANWFWVHNRWKAQNAKQSRIASAEEILPADPAMEIGTP
jgi:lauroyl/myristoyl acyltransferase